MIAVPAPATGRLADRVARDIARLAEARQLAPVAVTGISLGFGIISGAWFTELSVRGEVAGILALGASVATAQAALVMSGSRVTAATGWVRAACALLAEDAIYAGMAGGVSMAGGTGLTGPLGPQLSSGPLARIGGVGVPGVWLLAIVAAAVVALRHMADLCSTGPGAAGPGATGALRPLPRLGSVRLAAAGFAVILAGPRAGLLVAFVLGVLGLLYVLVRPADTVSPDPSGVAGYRGDGPLSAWIGGFVAGRLPPLPPLLVGLLVTCMLTVLGIGNLPGILVLAPPEAMLLATLGSSHLHAGRQDWRVPPLLQAGEYVFLAAAGHAGHVPPPITFGLVAVVGLRHLDMAYRARNRVPLSWFMARQRVRLPRADWRGFGWEGRMIIAGLALLFGVTTIAYAVLAAYLAALAVIDLLAGWVNASLERSPVTAQKRPPGPRR